MATKVFIYEPRKAKPGERIGAAERRMFGMRFTDVGKPSRKLLVRGLIELIRSELETPRGRKAFQKMLKASKKKSRSSSKRPKSRPRRRAATT